VTQSVLTGALITSCF